MLHEQTVLFNSKPKMSNRRLSPQRPGSNITLSTCTTLRSGHTDCIFNKGLEDRHEAISDSQDGDTPVVSFDFVKFHV